MTSNCNNMGTCGEMASLFYIGSNPIQEHFVAIPQRKANMEAGYLPREHHDTSAMEVA
jgi:hypothetical protein